jgi:hypothetical protein
MLASYLTYVHGFHNICPHQNIQTVQLGHIRFGPSIYEGSLVSHHMT